MLLFPSRSIPEPRCCLAQPYNWLLWEFIICGAKPLPGLGHRAQSQPQLLRIQGIHLTGLLGRADCCEWRVGGGGTGGGGDSAAKSAASLVQDEARAQAASQEGFHSGLHGLAGGGKKGLPQGSLWLCQARPTRQSFCAWKWLEKIEKGVRWGGENGPSGPRICET